MYNQVRVLIVEDDKIQALVTETLLESLNYMVVGIADTGEKAIRMFETRKPDLVLMDIKLKGEMDGIETARELLKSSHVSLIYITGNTDVDYSKRIKETRYIDFLNKPINKEILSDALVKCFI